MQLRIDNEYDRLEAVLVHRPGREIDRLTHDNMHDFLFEDIPYLKRMQEEHDAFVEAMTSRGIQSYCLESLLTDLVRDESNRHHIVREICVAESVPALSDDLSNRKYWDDVGLVDLLFAGLTDGEYHNRTGRRLGSGDEDAFLLPPIPNAYFTRDPAVVVHNTVISSKMHYRERVRESLLVRAVLEHHPDMRGCLMAYGGSDEPAEDRPYTVEGGDVIILSPDAILVGASERTRSETIECLAGKCFRMGDMKRVYEIPIPAERSFMHLDTVFTIVDRGMVLWFDQVMDNAKRLHRYELDAGGTVRRIAEPRNLVDILRDEFEADVIVIETAGGSKHYAAREQRTDGTNVFAIAPRVVVAYERNERTIEALAAHGVECISVEGAELVRGLGGPRCMTMPLRRSSAAV